MKLERAGSESASRSRATRAAAPSASVGAAPATLKLNMRDDAEDGTTLPAGQEIELLDCAGDWAWITCGPEGPSGYVRLGQLAPVIDA